MPISLPRYTLPICLIATASLLYFGLRSYPLNPLDIGFPHPIDSILHPPVMSNAFYTDAIVLFGDSITEAAWGGSFSHRVAEAYSRRLDVVNRGFGGYNSEWGVPVFKQVWAKKADRDAGKAQKVKLLTIWWGANDATQPGDGQHVPLERYKENLATTISMVRSPSSPYYSPETKIILITPGPVIYEEWHDGNRLPGHAAKYAAACKEVGEKEGLPVLDTFSAIVEAAGGESRDKLLPYFSDGLHMTPAGYLVHFKAFMKVLAGDYPELLPERIEYRMPYWEELVAPADFNKRIAEAGERRARGEL